MRHIARWATMVAIFTLAFVATSSAQSAGSLGPGQALNPGDSVSSPDGRFTLVYQDDGNLVLYRWDGVPLWASGTDGDSAGEAVMQSDGNFVVYTGDGTPVSASGTAGDNGAYMSVQDDGNLVIYSSDGVPLWASGTGGY